MKQNMETLIEYRLAQKVDIERISQLLQKAFEPYKSFYTPAAFKATTLSGFEIEKRFDDGPVWVAFYNKEIIGTLSGLLDGEKILLRSMAVDPVFQGQKVGLNLLKTAENYAFNFQVSCMYLFTTPFLYQAIHLYEKFEFVKKKHRIDNLYGTPLIYMEKYIK
jgi:N-acetylglutamate synthase-like GNAT family acetyltransferase